MRRLLLAIALTAIAVTAGACAASEAPGWTFAPPTPSPAVTPAPSGDPTPVPGGETEPPAGTVFVSAVNIAFEQKEIAAPAGTGFVIRFDNKDAGVPHNVEIKDASGMSMFKGEIFNGLSVRDYQVPPLAAGTYQFICTVHPNMVGTLTVGG